MAGIRNGEIDLESDLKARGYKFNRTERREDLGRVISDINQDIIIIPRNEIMPLDPRDEYVGGFYCIYVRK